MIDDIKAQIGKRKEPENAHEPLHVGEFKWADWND
jgi:hypothetical protein